MMRRLMQLIVSLALLAPPLVWADGMASLERFVKGVSSGRAVFTQVVTSPGRDGQAGKTRTSTAERSGLMKSRSIIQASNTAGGGCPDSFCR